MVCEEDIHAEINPQLLLSYNFVIKKTHIWPHSYKKNPRKTQKKTVPHAQAHMATNKFDCEMLFCRTLSL